MINTDIEIGYHSIIVLIKDYTGIDHWFWFWLVHFVWSQELKNHHPGFKPQPKKMFVLFEYFLKFGQHVHCGIAINKPYDKLTLLLFPKLLFLNGSDLHVAGATGAYALHMHLLHLLHMHPPSKNQKNGFFFSYFWRFLAINNNSVSVILLKIP